MKTTIDGWKNAEDIESKYDIYVDKKLIWNYDQNNPELVVEDILKEMQSKNVYWTFDQFKDFLYATLLKRGINKWLFVRRLLIRYKKWIVVKINELENDANHEKETAIKLFKKEQYTKGNRHMTKYHRMRGEIKAYNQVRKDLKIMCMAPRWVVWNYKNPGLYDTSGMKKGFMKKFDELFHRLWDRRFER